jgi:hypothetical protein
MRDDRDLAATASATLSMKSASNDFVPRDHHAKSVLPDTPDHHDADERGRDILGRK